MSKGVDLRELKARRYAVFVVGADDTISLLRDNLDTQTANRVAPYYRLTLHDKRSFITARVIGPSKWQRSGQYGVETFTIGPDDRIVRTIEFYEED